MQGSCYNSCEWCWASEHTTMQQAQLGMFFAAVTAWVVCGCILTRKPTKKPLKKILQPTVPQEHQLGCFAPEEERGSNWTGSSAPRGEHC